MFRQLKTGWCLVTFRQWAGLWPSGSYILSCFMNLCSKQKGSGLPWGRYNNKYAYKKSTKVRRYGQYSEAQHRISYETWQMFLTHHPKTSAFSKTLCSHFCFFPQSSACLPPPLPPCFPSSLYSDASFSKSLVAGWMTMGQVSWHQVSLTRLTSHSRLKGSTGAREHQSYSLSVWGEKTFGFYM